MPGFLTLEGVRQRRRDLSCMRRLNLNDVCGLSAAPRHSIFKEKLTEAQASARRAADVAKLQARTQTEEEKFYDEYQRMEPMMKREDLFSKPADDPSATQSIFAHYGIESGMSDDDIALHLGKLTLCGLVHKGVVVPSMSEAQLRVLGYHTGELHGLFSKIGKAFSRITAPARKVFRKPIQAFKKFVKPVTKLVKPITRKITVKNVGKAVRGYAGVLAMPLTAMGFPPEMVNKIGGFTGGLANTMAKVGKGMNMLTPAVMSVAGAPGVAQMLGPKGSAALDEFVASPAGQSFMSGTFGGQEGGVLMKDGLGSVFKLASGAGGQGSPIGGFLDKLGGTGGVTERVGGILQGLMGSKYKEEQMPPETVAAMEPNIPYPTLGDAEMGLAPFVAGSSSLAPGGEDFAPRRLGAQGVYPPAQVMFQPTAIQEAQVFPQEAPVSTTPMMEHLLTRAPYVDQASIRDLFSEQSEVEKSVAPVDDVEIDDSLQGILKRARAPKPGSGRRRSLLGSLIDYATWTASQSKVKAAPRTAKYTSEYARKGDIAKKAREAEEARRRAAQKSVRPWFGSSGSMDQDIRREAEWQAQQKKLEEEEFQRAMRKHIGM